MKTQQQYRRDQLQSLHVETGGSILVSPIASSIPENYQPNNFKILLVFTIATFIGVLIGWFLTKSINNEKLKSAELESNLAKLNLARNQENIDNFCKMNSSNK